jgi:hypothetical protein
MRSFNTSKSRAARGRVLRFENLEDRSMLAGDVTAEVILGTLTLRGDARGNSVQTWQSGPNQWKVQGLATTINGSSSIQTFDGVLGLSAFLEQGNDSIRISNGTLAGQLTISDSADPISIRSNDVVQISNVRALNVVIFTNDGSDNVSLDRVRSTNGLGIETASSTADGNDVVMLSNCRDSFAVGVFTGVGADMVTINGLTATGANFQITTNDPSTARDGSDSVSLMNLNIGLALSLFTGAGNDTVSISNLTAQNLGVELGSGNDTATIMQVNVNNSVGLAAGAGTDTVTLNRVNAPRNNIQVLMGAGNNDRLIVIQCVADIATFDGGGNSGDMLILARNSFDTLATTGFSIIIRA